MKTIVELKQNKYTQCLIIMCEIILLLNVKCFMIKNVLS
jgi:hypothetical protein